MTDMEKVISDVISAFDDWENNRCCPGDDWSDVHQSRDMVIALLKAQEPVEPIRDINGVYYCGNCDTICVGYESEFIHGIIKVENYCHKCGRKVKWDG